MPGQGAGMQRSMIGSLGAARSASTGRQQQWMRCQKMPNWLAGHWHV